MKVSLNWLRELVELPPTVPALVDLLTLAGVEVEEVITTGCNIPNVVVAQIDEFSQHPNADKLSVCKVNDGTGTQRQIVCGAKNFKAGDKVPLALPGATLPGDFTIKAGKLRGVESNGMLCSGEELGITDDADGLLILSGDPAVGTPIGELFKGDTVLDLEVTPNRPDLLSVSGIAREIATLTGKTATLRGPASTVQSGTDYPVQVHAADLCPFYTARRITGVKVGATEECARRKLEACGQRSINNIVDVTNYLMLEFGQPLHAFDAAKLKGNLQVRLAKDGEQFLALDGKTYTLKPTHLVIADDERAVAIAGVMGGQDTGVTESTTEVILESAWFSPQSVRRTSRELGLSSDSSYRFERTVDPAGVQRVSDYAVELIRHFAGGEVTAAGTAGAPPVTNDAVIPLRSARLASLLGTSVPDEKVDQILTGFGLTKVDGGWKAPSFRPDLVREVDLVEEVARVVGMDAIPARTQARFTAASGSDKTYDRTMALRRAFSGLGLHEARSITLVPAEPLGAAALGINLAGCHKVKNPMNDEQVLLRPHLLHGLLSAVRHNLRGGAKSVRLFETGRVFSTQRPEEFLHAAIVLTGPVSERNWRAAEGKDADIFDLKALLSAVFPSVSFEKKENPAAALSFSLTAGGKVIGTAGQLWPADARALDAQSPVLFAELDLTALWKTNPPDAARKYQEIARFPGTNRDIAMLAPLELAHAEVEKTLLGAKEPLLTGVELFDVFTDPTGAKVPADKKSLAVSLTYRSPERTLTADEVNAAHSRLKSLLPKLGVTLRE